MKRIKYLGVLLSIVTLCVACEKSEKDGLGGFHKNFVELYVDGQIMLTEFQNECSGDAHRLSKKQIAGFVICIPSGKSSVSCPLKPSDSAPLKHSTMPP